MLADVCDFPCRWFSPSINKKSANPARATETSLGARRLTALSKRFLSRRKWQRDQGVAQTAWHLDSGLCAEARLHGCMDRLFPSAISIDTKKAGGRGGRDTASARRAAAQSAPARWRCANISGGPGKGPVSTTIFDVALGKRTERGQRDPALGTIGMSFRIAKPPAPTGKARLISSSRGGACRRSGIC